MADRNTWLRDFDLITTTSKYKTEDKAARDVFDALEKLEKSGLLIQKFHCPEKQRQAIFLFKNFPEIELIRVVVRFDWERVVVGRIGNHPNDKKKKWPEKWEWEADFQNNLKTPPIMGPSIVDWCVASDGNTEKLIRWLTDKAKEKSGQAAPLNRGRINTAETILADIESTTPESNGDNKDAGTKSEAAEVFCYPDEIQSDEKILEGAKLQVVVNKYERDPAARSRCIAHYGRTCVVCGFNFAAAYGAIGERMIHVHHLRELSEIGQEYEVDPIQDLRPVCPNCHFVIHQRKPCYRIDEVKAFLRP